MPLDIAALNPPELVVLLVGLGGLIPVALYARDLPRWVIAAYGFLLFGAIATNVEHVLWYDAVNAVEHGVGNLGAGIAFALIAYRHGRRIRDTADDDASTEDL
ncbi:hypothetical protein [Salinigranum sp. GCM10025319]|uniref:hypothetical protein n=1 Tax=Salinigranum sp. GCM10025319 TaxID=3252687 RepID=UPI003613AAD5